LAALALAALMAPRPAAAACTSPSGALGARDWFSGSYHFCDGSAWEDFSIDGSTGSCSAAARMDWNDSEAAHTICNGTQEQVLRYVKSACALTSQTLNIGESVADSDWDSPLNAASAITIFDGGAKAALHARWNGMLSTWDISGSPDAPVMISASGASGTRVDVPGIAVRNGYVFTASPQSQAAGRIWASPVSNLSTSYSWPSSGSAPGNKLCNTIDLAMNDAGTVAYIPAWDSGAASCPTSTAYSGGCILNVIDTSDPTAMSVISQVNLTPLLSNGNVYCSGAYLRGTHLFLPFASGPGPGGLLTLDVSNPAAPAVLSQKWLSGGNTQFDYMGASEDGTLAILVSRTGRVVSIDVSNPASPVVLDDSLSLPTSGDTSDVLVVNNYAFVAAGPDDVYAVNIADPANLTLDATISDSKLANIGQMTLLGDNIYYTGQDDGRFGLLNLNCDVEGSGQPNLGACSRKAAIEFDSATPLYKYCDGGSWRPMSGCPEGGGWVTGSSGISCCVPPPLTWTGHSAAEANFWSSIAYGNGTFVALARDGTHRVMTSSDGVSWTARSAPGAAHSWFGVAYGNGLFVAVADSGNVMTSPDGITWTMRTAPEANGWLDVTYGGGQFVAVANNGTHRVMTSPDGITWTARTAAEPNSWFAIAYGGGLFVAVSQGTGTHRVMTSPDGITWTARNAAEQAGWMDVAYGNGMFVAVNWDGTNKMMTSPDGITWTARSDLPTAYSWNGVAFGGGFFVALANGGSNRAMISPDGITWTPGTIPSSSWNSAAYGQGKFVAMASGGTLQTAIANLGSCP
jgi:hypothetical protein